MTEQIKKTLRDSAAARWTALLLLSLAMFCSYIFVDILSPIKDLMLTQRGWDSTAFGTMQSSETFLNVFVFFLIFAGIILDKMGVRFTALLSGAVMLTGALIKYYAISESFIGSGLETWFTENLNYVPLFEQLGVSPFYEGMPASAKLAAIGFMLFGCGTEMAGIMVSRGIVKWFKGKEMALAMGIEMALARFGVFAIFRLSPWLSEKFETIQAPVIFVALLLCIGLMLYVVYWFMDKALDKDLEGEEEEAEEPFKFSDLGKVFGSGVFWVVAILCVLYYSAIFPFQKFATEMLHYKVGFETKDAADYFSYFPIGAMIITPLLGFYLDRRGKGATMLILGSILMIICHLTFALYPFVPGSTSSTVIAMSAIVVLGVSFSLVPATLWPSVPKLIDNKVLGSAYSAIFWIQNVGLMSVPIVIGSILDSVNKGVPEGQPKDYTLAMLVFASFGVIALLMSLLLKAIDKKKQYGLELPNVK